jgi:hypothetical protein
MKLYIENFITTFEADIPKCTTAKQYKVWQIAAKQCPPAIKAGFCEDCTPKYQAEMIRKHRCENPHVRFCKDKNGFLCGTVGIKTSPKLPKKSKGVLNVLATE